MTKLITKKTTTADNLFRKLIHQTRKSCERCGMIPFTEVAHIESRGKKSLRWSEDNALLLCRKCHLWWHANPEESRKWFNLMFPVQSAFLERERNKLEVNTGETLEFSINRLRERLREVRANEAR